MGSTKSTCVVFLLASFLCISTVVGCTERESEALLEFKAGLEDPADLLSSWVGQDCCSWSGVRCNNRTRHVVRLDLRNIHPPVSVQIFGGSRWSLRGLINPSLLGLKHLTYLDLSWNSFGGIRIPSFIGSFERLRYLNLSGAGFGGTIPHQLGNLSHLHSLDLSYNLVFQHDPHDSQAIILTNSLHMDDTRWLSYLSSLQYLNLGSVNLSKAFDLINSLNTLSSLVEIRLIGCDIDIIPSFLPLVNFTTLCILDLSENNINSTIPDWIFNISSLEYLDLRENYFNGLIPAAIGNLTSLKDLFLSSNYRFRGGIPTTLRSLCKLRTLDISGISFGGKLAALGEIFSGCIQNSLEDLDLSSSYYLAGHSPDWLGDLKNLKTLDLSGNSRYGLEMNETLPKILGKLSKLVHLDLSYNSFEFVLSEAHFANLTRLEYLDISSSGLILNVTFDWVPPFQLTYLSMRSCKVGPQFPAWLRKLENISHLDMSHVGISYTMPDWFWNFSSKITNIDLSHNEIKGQLPNSLSHVNLEVLDLHSNHFEGPLPQFASSLEQLDLSNNSFSGPLPQFPSSTLELLDLSNNSFSGAIFPNFGEMMPNLFVLSLSMNSLNGSIPMSICNLTKLITLDLSKNHLSGEIPNCWNYSLGLYVMDLSNNHLSGSIPASICSQPLFHSLHLSNNNLSGELPLPLKNCKSMTTLDLGGNKFTGNIPTWLGGNLLSLEILRLRSNLFVGNIPLQLGSLTSLQVIDIANNNLSGTIPHSFGNFSAMKARKALEFISYAYYLENIAVVMKGRESEYDDYRVSLVRSIDLSDNNLSGEIPEELAALLELQTLNLSGNHLTGNITEKINGLRMLETLDLSINNLSGEVPPSLSSLSFLNHLNLSYNKLSGRIPSGGQLQALPDPSIYVGNPDLCGFPLNVKCQGDGTSLVNRDGEDQDGEDENGSEMVWLYSSIGPGFVVGFWAVFGVLLLKTKWRIAYFLFVDSMYDKLLWQWQKMWLV